MCIKKDCIYFNGYKPCEFHKKERIHCDNCEHYDKYNKTVLIIKLQAGGEVIRTTPLLHKLKGHRIFWLTKFPDLIPKDKVYKILEWGMNSILFLLDQKFDIVFSLDKDLEACSLANLVKAEIKKGFSQKDGVIVPFDIQAESKWLTGIFDDLMEKNQKHYVQEIFDICGFKWMNEKYILPKFTIPKINLKTNKKIIGLNIGAGPIWKTRVLSEKKIVSLVKELSNKYEVILLGGLSEDLTNQRLASKTNAKYFGTFNLNEFIGLMSLCDLILTGVTMALHIAIGLNKKIILLNNIFPLNEFYLFENGKILEPNIPCKKCYKTKFDSDCLTKDCLDIISNKEIITAIEDII
ncbi:MAG: glycosyltransferase family 9 protein [Candidatus Cloacimonetes bacterium]|nr:glycosyltransferase family 9 protein [Candidatus Cloacimonadota bacterium]